MGIGATATIRASEADIVINCGLAATPPATPISTTSPEAQLGLAAHDALEPWVLAGADPLRPPIPQPWANQRNADVDRVRDLIEAAPELLARVREHIGDLQPETKIEGGGVRGRIDVLSLLRGANTLFGAAVLDWKTGRDPAAGSKPMQRLAYASAVEATHGMPVQGYIYTAELWLAADTVVESRWDADSIAGFRRALADKLERREASPGPHCRYCRRLHECTERDEWLRSAGRAIAIAKDETPTVEALADLWDQAKALRVALNRYDDAVDQIIEATGELPLPDGRRVIHENRATQRIDARLAWAVMVAAGLTGDQINQALRLSKTELLKIVAAMAPRGGKAAAKTEIMNRLTAAGAVIPKRTRIKRVV